MTVVDDELSLVFSALADPTRRAILEQLSNGAATGVQDAIVSRLMWARSRHLSLATLSREPADPNSGSLRIALSGSAHPTSREEVTGTRRGARTRTDGQLAQNWSFFDQNCAN